MAVEVLKVYVVLPPKMKGRVEEGLSLLFAVLESLRPRGGERQKEGGRGSVGRRTSKEEPTRIESDWRQLISL